MIESNGYKDQANVLDITDESITDRPRAKYGFTALLVFFLTYCICYVFSDWLVYNVLSFVVPYNWVTKHIASTIFFLFVAFFPPIHLFWLVTVVVAEGTVYITVNRYSSGQETDVYGQGLHAKNPLHTKTKAGNLPLGERNIRFTIDNIPTEQAEISIDVQATFRILIRSARTYYFLKTQAGSSVADDQIKSAIQSFLSQVAPLFTAKEFVRAQGTIQTYISNHFEPDERKRVKLGNDGEKYIARIKERFQGDEEFKLFEKLATLENQVGGDITRLEILSVRIAKTAQDAQNVRENLAVLEEILAAALYVDKTDAGWRKTLERKFDELRMSNPEEAARIFTNALTAIGTDVRGINIFGGKGGQDESGLFKAALATTLENNTDKGKKDKKDK